MLIRHQAAPIIPALWNTVGFSHPIPGERAQKRRDRALAELLTTAGLVVCLAIAVTAVSIGISRANTFCPKFDVSCVQ